MTDELPTVNYQLIIGKERDESFCEGLICAGRKIVADHFNMKKLCATQLVRIYKEQIKER